MNRRTVVVEGEEKEKEKEDGSGVDSTNSRKQEAATGKQIDFSVAVSEPVVSEPLTTTTPEKLEESALFESIKKV